MSGIASSISVREPSPSERRSSEVEAASEEFPHLPGPAVAKSPEEVSDIGPPSQLTPAESVFAAVRESARRVLTTPTKDADFAEALGVSSAQAKVWVKRLVEEGVIEKQRKPPGYIVKQSNLFE